MYVAIIQARVNSTRFPNKVFQLLAGKPLIWHVVNRLRYSKYIDKIVLATTTNSKDDKLVWWAEENKVDFFRGSEENVLERFYMAAKAYCADRIVRITADDPFKDPKIIDEVIELREIENLDFAYNNNPPSFPEGLDTEVFTFNALERAFKEANEDYEKEHVTQYFYRNRDSFRQKNLSRSEDISYLRWTIDTERDYLMVEKIYDSLFHENSIFSTDDILAFLNANPDVIKINSEVPRSLMYKK